ncbi:MAG: UDP-N-acetylmuramate dehydrogenase [Firmicutes bacterium]|nr:UDP-N-acetylmuramate dehydrogenase [Bacillota bacterium]
MNIVKEIKQLHVGKVIEYYELKDHTTYKVGGKAICAVIPEDEKKLITLLSFLRDNNIKYKVLGNGSNVIFNDSGYNGVIIKLDNFNHLNITGNKIVVGAGYPLNKLALRVSRLGFTGMEFAAGIPGTVGGAVYMNAGAYKSDMGYILTSIKVLTPDYQIKVMKNKELDFHYRTSFLQNNKDYICLEATISLIKGNSEEIIELINERKKRRLETQPLEYPSAGSVFRNPEGDFAGRLIEEIGYKGKSIGGACVSEKHANFIINTGSATGEEVKELINEIKQKIKEKYNIELKVEQEFVE